MKKIFKSFVFILLIANFIFTPLLYGLDDIPIFGKEPLISMDFQDASLKNVMKVLSIQSKLNFLASEAVQERKLTLFMEKVPLREAMDKIFKANNLSYELDQEAKIFIVKDWGKPSLETVTEVFYLKHATVSSSSLKEEMKDKVSTAQQSTTVTSTTGTTTESEDKGKWKVEEDCGITQSVKKILSENGSVIEDFRTNSLIVTDIPSKMVVIRKVIKSLDIPVPQLVLEVEMLDVGKDVVDLMGVKFSGHVLNASITSPTTGATMGFPFHSWGKISGGGFGTLNVGSTLAAELDFLRTRTDTKTLARPKLLTLNNETAEIKISTLESIGVVTTTDSQGVSTGTPERSTTGILLRVTPQIDTENNEVTMFIVPEVIVADLGSAITVAAKTYQYRDPETRGTRSSVRIKDGETVVIGGLIRKDLNVVETKVPILGDIPVLGSFFRHKNQTKNKDRELLVFITPRIIKDSAAGGGERIAPVSQAKRMILPAREQSTVSVISRQSSINTYLNTLDKQR